jgi:hypothetical protein
MIFDELWRAQRERTKLHKTFDPLISKAEQEKRWDDSQSLISEFLMERNVIDDKISWIETKRVRKRAEKFGVPIPPLSDKECWEEGFTPNTVRLKPEARIRISEQVRKERRARIEDRMLWVDYLGPLVSPLTGLLGVVIGLVALLRSCK